MVEFNGESTKYGNDASSNEDLNLKWGFNISDDVSPEELLNFFNCVCEIFGAINVLKAVGMEAERKDFNELLISAEYRLNGMALLSYGRMVTKYIVSPTEKDYVLRMNPVGRMPANQYLDLVLILKEL